MASPGPFKPSKVVAVFLARFNVHSGYELVWSKSNLPSFDFNGVDYKVLPLGIHEADKATVLVTQKSHGTLYYGLGRFIQSIVGDSSNRDNVHMYSLGVFCDPKTDAWKPNEFINCGWEYIDTLDEALSKFLASDDPDYQSFEAILNPSLTPGDFRPNISHHLISKLPQLFEYLGPLVFPIYKQSLLRKRILLFNNNHDHSSPLSPDYLFTLDSFDYLISLLSLIPQDTNRTNSNNYYSQPLYNVGLPDIELFQVNGYIATTNDDILMYHPDKYDIGVVINGKVNPEMYRDAGKKDFPIKANLKDYKKLKYLISNFQQRSYPMYPMNEDLRSIHSHVSNYDGEVCESPGTFNVEPEWWLTQATSPISWREFIWSAFAWFASAGNQYNDENLVEATSGKPIDFVQLINIIGYFHSLTRKWFYIINAIVAEEIEQNQQSKLTIELSYQDIIDMELDPYDDSDLSFVREFVLLYWKQVDQVDIGIGFSICC